MYLIFVFVRQNALCDVCAKKNALRTSESEFPFATTPQEPNLARLNLKNEKPFPTF